MMPFVFYNLYVHMFFFFSFQESGNTAENKLICFYLTFLYGSFPTTFVLLDFPTPLTQI